MNPTPAQWQRWKDLGWTGRDTLHARNAHGQTLVHWATSPLIQHYHPDLLAEVIHAGADPSAKNDNGLAPLAVLLRSGQDRADTMRALLDLKAPLVHHSAPGVVPSLVLAACEGLIGMVEVLLEYGADPNVAHPHDEEGCAGITAAMASVFRPRDDGQALVILQRLAAAGADLTATDAKGWTVAWYALNYGKLDMLDWLVARGHRLNPDAKDHLGRCLGAMAGMKTAQQWLHQHVAGQLHDRLPAAAPRPRQRM